MVLGVAGAVWWINRLGETSRSYAREDSLSVVQAKKVSVSANPGAHPARRDKIVSTHPAIRRVRLGGRHGRFPSRWARLTAKQVGELTDFARKYLPEEYQEIELLRQENPNRARVMLYRLWWLYRRVKRYPPEIRKAAVERHRLNIAILTTRRDILKCTDKNRRAKLVAELRKLLNKQFDFDQTVKEWRVKQLAKQITELKAQIERREKERDKIIAERLKRLLQPVPAWHSTTRPTGSTRHKPFPPAKRRGIGHRENE